MKKIFAIVTILVTLAACTKTEQNTATTTSPKTITLKAGISNDATKMAFSEDAETGISSTFEKDDVIYVFDASGKMTEFTVESVDGDGVATFTGTPETPIAEDDPITAVVKNSGTTVSGTKVSLNLNSQAGTLESAGKHALMYAEGTYKSTGVSLMFEHKTSIVKFVLSLPEAETATSIKNFYLFTVEDRSTVTDLGGAQFTYFNKVDIDALSGDVTNGKTGNGWIEWSTASAVSEHKATVYLSVPAVNLRNAALQCTPNSNDQKRYFWNIAGSSALTINAGKAYTITRTQTQFAPSAAGKTFFYSDDAQVYNFGLPQGAIVTYSTSTGDWLSKETDGEGNMQIRMSANTTGSPREATLTFKVFGAFCKYSVAQANPEDFYDDFTMSSFQKFSGKIGAGNAFSVTAQGTSGTQQIIDGSSYPTQTVTISELTGQPTIVSSKDGTHTNNILIKGLCEDLVAKGELKIDYGTTNATVGIYLQQPLVKESALNTPVNFTTSGFDSYYAWLMPELSSGFNTSTGALTWRLDFGSLGADSQVWYLGNISVVGNTTKILWSAHHYWNASTSKYVSTRPTLKTSTTYSISGLMVDAFSYSGTTIGSNSTTKIGNYTLVRNVSNVAKTVAAASTNSAAYHTVYQGDILFTKTAAVADPAPIATPVVDNENW